MKTLNDRHKISSNFRINEVIRLLTFSDGFLWGGFYMMNALVAVYLDEKFEIDPLQTISIGFAVYMISRSVFQIPVAQLLDKLSGFIDEVYAVALGGIIAAIAIFLYRFISEPWHLFLIQIIFGLGMAINVPAWRKIFAKFVDKGHEALEYGIYDVINNIIIASLTALGGFVMAKFDNFELLFTISSIFMVLGGLIAILMKRFVTKD